MRILILYLLLAASITISLLACFYETFPGDVWVIEWTQNHHNSSLTDIMEVFTFIGESDMMIGLAGIMVGLMLASNHHREGLTALGALGIMTLLSLMKLIIDRPRPPADLVGILDNPGDPGFPSGHTFHSLIIFGFIIFMASVFIRRTWLRRTVQILLGMVVVIISISRVYLGHHWPSDVLGSYIIGGFFLTLLTWAYHKNELPRFLKRKQ